jgi:hypothetical protein
MKDFSQTYPAGPVPKAAAKQPVPPGKQFPETIPPHALSRFFDLWFQGVRVLGRFLAFWITLLVVMTPLMAIGLWLNPQSRAVYQDGSFHWVPVIQLVLLVVYLPFACLISAKHSRQLLKSAP